MEKEDLQNSIEVLQEQCRAFEREGKFKKAQMIKNQIEEELLREEAKIYDEIQGKQENERIELEDSHLLEYQEFISNWDKRLNSHKKDSDQQIFLMIEKHKREKIQLLEKLEKQISLTPKPSAELLNMLKIQEGLIKIQDYGEAHKVQQRVNLLTKGENHDWDKERKRKIMQQEAHLDKRQEIELNALRKRLNTIEDEMKTMRIAELESLLQKYQNAKKELQNYQIQELNKFSSQRSVMLS
ncbi:hypothetical protein SteCoe_5776 [Stentor coeruleus]|uniref:Uncharacterized protein n=1 Tax=Stentor coeruleus TaxID=5963 RepID=A0A1R2CRL0_9CILI|nr:hypothetical protein SteCoe_5776 [Stentor coeruleus]